MPSSLVTIPTLGRVFNSVPSWVSNTQGHPDIPTTYQPRSNSRLSHELPEWFPSICISVHSDWPLPLPGRLVIFFNISPAPITYLLSPHHWKPPRSRAFLIPSLLSCASPTQAELPPTLNSFESYGLFLLIRYLIVPGLVSFVQLFLWVMYFPSSHEFLKLEQI